MAQEAEVEYKISIVVYNDAPILNAENFGTSIFFPDLYVTWITFIQGSNDLFVFIIFIIKYHKRSPDLLKDLPIKVKFSKKRNASIL